MSTDKQGQQFDQGEREAAVRGSQNTGNSGNDTEERTIMVRVDSHYVCLSPSQFAELCGTK
jgi:hypothetical protein